MSGIVKVLVQMLGFDLQVSFPMGLFFPGNASWNGVGFLRDFGVQPQDSLDVGYVVLGGRQFQWADFFVGLEARRRAGRKEV